MTRRVVALVVVVIVLAAVALLLKSCVDTSRRNGLKDFNSQVNDIGSQSISNVSQGLEVIANKDLEPLAQRNQLSDLATDSSKLTDRARDLSSPGGLDGATYYLATALSLRATALDRISEVIGKARGTTKAEQEAATQQIAGQMEAMLASDVLWELRVTPFIKERFQAEDLNSESIATSKVLKDLAWVNPATVATRIGGFTTEPDTETPLAPGTHGHGITSVAVNGKALTAGSVTTIPASASQSFTVTIENQGENDEQDVTVSVSGTKQGGGTKIDETKKIPQSLKGSKTPVSIPLKTPVKGSYSVTVEVRPVRGEGSTDNNKATYSVIFQ